MMQIRTLCLPCVLLIAAAATAGEAPCIIGSPEMPASQVDATGALLEDWGRAALHIESPEAAELTGQVYTVSPTPQVVTTKKAGRVVLKETSFRAPIWPNGADVLDAELSHLGGGEAQVRLRLELPENMSAGERAITMGGRPVVLLPAGTELVRERNPFGRSGGVALPGWAKPQNACDPAFANIAAGMGGVPIVYAFSVPPGAARTVALGLCESHWDRAGVRPVLLEAEGAEPVQVDPVAEWCRHVPGCVLLNARDADADGYLTVRAAPGRGAQDKNPILNVVWVFPPEAQVAPAALVRGDICEGAEYYIDVGGPADQELYKPGPVTFTVTVDAQHPTRLLFLMAPPGGAVPGPADYAWTLAEMRKAANDVWTDWFARAGLLEDTADAEAKRQQAARILLCRKQANGYFMALPGCVGLDAASHRAAAEAIIALDDAGAVEEAERLLRLYWDAPAPEAFAAMAQRKDGAWTDNVEGPCPQGRVLSAMVYHVKTTRDMDWAEKAWPAVRKGAEWLLDEARQAGLCEVGRQEAVLGLQHVAVLAEKLGRQEDAARYRDAAAKLGP